MKNNEVLLQILPTGEIRFKRGSAEQNKNMLAILSEIAPEKVSDLKEFFKGSEDIIVLEGNTIFCG